MKLRLTISALAVGLATLTALPDSVQARVWTSSADKNRRFKADFVKCENDVVTVRMKSGTPLSFPISTVSAPDQAYVRKLTGPVAPAATRQPDAPTLDLPEVFGGKLVKLDARGKLRPFAYADGKAPDYFILYVSAYW